MFFYLRIFLIVYSFSYITPPNTEARDISLYYAAELGDSVRVQTLLNKGVPIDEPDNKGRTALIYAASRGHTSIVKMLLAKGANIHAEGEYQLNPLHAAIKRHHTEIVKILLDAGADIHLGDVKGNKPLQIAVELGHQDIVELLLKKGADPNTLSHTKGAVLNIALNNGHSKIANLLRQYGANLNAHTPKSQASANLTQDTIAKRKSLEKGVEPATALRLAIELNDTTLVRQLIGSDVVDVNATTEGNVTPLMVAVSQNNLSITQMLIDAGADLFLRDEKRRTALSYTVHIGDQKKRKTMQLYLHQIMNSRYIQH